jgi:hypothetical protein
MIGAGDRNAPIHDVIERAEILRTLGCSSVPDVQEHEGRGAARSRYKADDKEELTVLLRRYVKACDPRTAYEGYSGRRTNSEDRSVQ